MTEHSSIQPVILSGGAGTRLWPLSRALYPKQFLPLAGEHTMLQDTVLRVSEARFAAPLLICNDEHRFIAAEQLRAIGCSPREIILEPVGRNTAPAVAVAALRLRELAGEQALLLVMPSDHVIQDRNAFLQAVEQAAAAARQGAMVTFGITPDRAETGYGYIRLGAPWTTPERVHGVAQFVEKPDQATAEGYLASGGYVWNSGLFLFSVQTYLSELERHQPDMLGACQKALDSRSHDLDFTRLEKAAFAASPADSIDYAVMEKTTAAAVVPVAMGWSDVGSWSALWDIGEKDAAGNVLSGDVIAQDTENAYIRADSRLVAVAGLRDVVAVVTDDAVLLAHRDSVQDVKAIVSELKAQGRAEHAFHTTVHRPWGAYRGIDAGERFQVKRIVVHPGEKLSLQMHYHRAEHWVVVTGTARVTRDDTHFLLHENESTFIPAGAVHRLENPGKLPLHLIEVQSGSYLGEDDIVRLEDGYGRGA